MKITLVRPTYGSRFQITPPLSLGYLASSLKQSGYSNIDLVDGSLHLLSPIMAIELIEKKGLPDIVGVQVYTGSHRWAREFVKALRDKYPNIIVIVGGPHITALKGLALKFIGADYGVIGEGETAIVQFVQYIEGRITNPHDVEGLLFKEGGEYKHATKMFGFFEDANKIPFPDWELLQPNLYYGYMEGATMPLRGKRPAPILTSRGCPFRCTFCSSGLTNKRVMRYRSPENILSEIKYLKENFGIDEIFISDDNLTLNIERAEKIFELIIENNLNIHWRAPNGIRVDCLTEDLVAKMRKSGGYYVGVGVESGNQRILQKIKKRLSLDVVRKNVDLLHKYNILVSGFFICGLISETEQEIMDSIKFAISTKFDRIQVSDYVPYPGSEDFETVFNFKTDQEYEKAVMDFQRKEIMPEFREMSLDEVVKMQKKFLLKFYSRPYTIFSMIKNFQIGQLFAIARHPYVRRWFVKNKDWYAS